MTDSGGQGCKDEVLMCMWWSEQSVRTATRWSRGVLTDKRTTFYTLPSLSSSNQQHHHHHHQHHSSVNSKWRRSAGHPIHSTLLFWSAHYLLLSRKLVHCSKDYYTEKRGSVCTDTDTFPWIDSVPSTFFAVWVCKHKQALWYVSSKQALLEVQIFFFSSFIYCPQFGPGHVLHSKTCKLSTSVTLGTCTQQSNSSTLDSRGTFLGNVIHFISVHFHSFLHSLAFYYLFIYSFNLEAAQRKRVGHTLSHSLTHSEHSITMHWIPGISAPLLSILTSTSTTLFLSTIFFFFIFFHFYFYWQSNYCMSFFCSQSRKLTHIRIWQIPSGAHLQGREQLRAEGGREQSVWQFARKQQPPRQSRAKLPKLQLQPQWIHYSLCSSHLHWSVFD